MALFPEPTGPVTATSEPALTSGQRFRSAKRTRARIRESYILKCHGNRLRGNFRELGRRSCRAQSDDMPQTTRAAAISSHSEAQPGGRLAEPLSVKKSPPLASFKAYHLIGPERAPTEFPEVSAKPVSVTFENVTFTYPGTGSFALQNLCLDIEAGSLVAVTGPVGSGKSAMARALLGLYPLDAGRILLDGKPLTDVTRDERAARVGYLPQDPYLFSGSISQNVLMGEPRADARVVAAQLEHAVSRAALDDDVSGFADGLDTQIGESGVRVSGGQRLRIALARALASSCPLSPGLLILDDPFSAVDVGTEARIIQALHEAFGPGAPPERRATILLCSHRLAAFPMADKVVVLDGGRIIEQGTHNELTQAGGLYARIYAAQRMVADDPPGKIPGEWGTVMQYEH